MSLPDIATSPGQTWPRLTSPPRLLATTGATYQTSISDSHARELPHQSHPPNHTPPPSLPPHLATESNLFKSAQWTPDGSTILTHSEDHGLRTFILPPTLLDPGEEPHRLTAYTTIFPAGAPVHSTCIHPSATLGDPSSFVFLAGVKNAPLRLHSLLHPTLLSSYRYVCPDTEAYLPAYSLLIPPSQSNLFIAGGYSQLAIFDLHRSGDGPLRVLKTIPTKRTPATTTTMKGMITALALAPETSVLAAGTYTRQIGLYADDGGGDCIGVFELAKDGIAGKGVTGLRWGEEGRYLYVSERMSEVVQVFDIRGSGERVRVLRGRNAGSNARMEVDVTAMGDAVAGGTDGMVRIWERSESEDPVGCWRAADDPINTAAVHPSGVVMATCSGERKTFGLPIDDEDDQAPQAMWDNTLKIWELTYPSPTKDIADSGESEPPAPPS